MPAPTLVTTVNLDTQPWSQTANIGTDVATLNYASTVVTQADDLLIVAQGEASGAYAALFATTTGLTWTQRVELAGGARCAIDIASAPDAAGGTRQVVFNRPLTGSGTQVGGRLFQFRAHGGVGNVAGPTDSVQTLALSCSANSSIIALFTDWNAVAGAASWATINGQAPTATFGVEGDTTNWAVAGAYWADVGAAGTKTITLSSPDFTAERIGAIEILAGSGGAQFARPNVDVSDDAWAPSTGADNYAVIDEETASDTDYTSVGSDSTLKVGLASVSTPAAGTQTFRVRARGSPSKKLIAKVIEGASTQRAIITIDPLTATFTDYSATASGIANYGDLDLEFAASDATTQPQITWGAIGTAASGTTSCAPAYPAGIAAATSHIFCVVTGRSNTAGTAPTMPAGWTSIGSLEGGTGTWGVDAGTRRVEIFKKDTTVGTESGTVTVSLAGTTANTLRASILRVEGPSGLAITASFVSGSDTTNGTAYSATGGTQAYAVNDLVLVATAQNLDTGTSSAHALTASGITFSARTNRADTAVNNGNDHRHIINAYAVTAGSDTVAPTFAYTVSAAASGPTGFLRLRVGAPTEVAAVSWAEFEVPAAGGATGSLTESAAATEAITATQTSARSLVETSGATETQAGAYAPSVTQPAEAATATEVQGGSKLQSATQPSESAAAAETQSATQAGTSTQSAESAAATEAQSATQSAARTQPAESAGATETQSAAQATARSMTEAAVTAATESATAVALGTVPAESAAAGEATTGASGPSGDLTETTAAAETEAATQATARALTETAVAGETPAATMAITVAMPAESVAAGEDATGITINLGVIADESAVAGESSDRVATFIATVPAESAAAAEAESATQATARSLTETAGTTEAPSATQVAARNQPAESAAAAEASDGVTINLGQMAESAAATEAESAIAAATGTQSESAAATETPTAATSSARTLTEAASASATENGGFLATVTTTETISAADAWQALAAAFGAVVEASAAADGAAAITLVGAAIVEAITADAAQTGIEAGAIMEETAEARDFVAWLRDGLAGEPRVLMISAENRVLTIDYENRTLSIPAENRVLMIPSEARSLNI